MKSKKICFLVGSVSISGGTYVILQHATYLSEQGIEVALAVQSKYNLSDIAWHPSLSKLKIVDFEEGQKNNYDVVIATWWKTALEIGKFNSNQYIYFVQSIESLFYPEKEIELRRLVNSTYELNLQFITEATWIQKELKSKYNKEAYLVRNGIRKELFSKLERRESEQIRFIVEGPFGVSFKNTALAIKILRNAGVKNVTLLTSTRLSWVPFVSNLYSNVPIHEVPFILSRADIMLKLSTVEGMFGPPLEMFHAGGTSITLDVSGYDEYMINDVNAVVVSDRRIETLITEIKRLASNKVIVDRLKKRAVETANGWQDWGVSSKLFFDSIECKDASSYADRGQLLLATRRAKDKYNQSAPKLDVVGKIKNLPRKVYNKISGRYKLWLNNFFAVYEIISVARIK